MAKNEISEKLLMAKHAAAERFFKPAEQTLEMITAFAASSKPEHNVVGVGVGRKVTKGKATRTRCVRIYVARKIARNAIPKDHMVPDKIQGVPTDVVETGYFRALPASVPKPQQRARPAQPGCSVGFQFTGSKANFVMAGTFGAVVEANGVRFILSNNHVLANENALPIGSPIFQPGLLDNGDPSKDQIARLTRFLKISAGTSNRLDCAVAEILDPRNTKATFLAKVGKLKSPAPIVAAESMHVHKVGRTTGYTRGTVFDVAADITVKYDLGIVTFVDQVLVVGDAGSFSAPGDSGSVIVDRATGRPTALLFAGSASHTLGNPLTDVLAQLQVTMVA